MQKLWKLAVVLTISLLLVYACRTSESPRARDETTEANVYSSLINKELATPFSYISLGDTVFIVNRTYNTTCYMCYENVSDSDLYDISRSLDRDTVKDFRAINNEVQVLNLPLSINSPYQFIDEPSPNDWGAIGHTQIDVLLVTMFSKIGFNDEMNQALVYMAHICGNECGVGNIYFLVQNGDTWEIEGTLWVWSS